MWESIKSSLRREYGREIVQERSTNKEDSKNRAYGKYLRRKRDEEDKDGMRRTRGEEKESPRWYSVRQASDLSALPVRLASITIVQRYELRISYSVTADPPSHRHEHATALLSPVRSVAYEQLQRIPQRIISFSHCNPSASALGPKTEPRAAHTPYQPIQIQKPEHCQYTDDDTIPLNSLSSSPTI